ncbi:hypothetical protein MRX96_058103 [Rhipicephalus microplus]
MKELGAESDEDVGLGLDLDDEEEFLKCIEDDCAGEPQDHKIASQPQKPLETSRTNLVESTKTQQPRRRLIRADIALHLSSSHDEGIEKDSGEDDSGGGDGGDGPGKTPHRAGLTLAKVLEMCASHLQDPAQADLHYKAVCRALVAEAVELSTFLQKISSGTKEFIKCHHSDPDTSDIDGLQFQDWAMLWMQDTTTRIGRNDVVSAHQRAVQQRPESLPRKVGVYIPHARKWTSIHHFASMDRVGDSREGGGGNVTNMGEKK